jgi:vesicle coat complex subunit
MPEATPPTADQIAEWRRMHAEQHPPGAYEQVLDLISDPDPHVRKEAALFLARHLRSRDEGQIILDILDSDPNPEVRKAAAECLGGVFRLTRDRNVSEVLTKLAKDTEEDGGVRGAAMAAIKKIHGQR